MKNSNLKAAWNDRQRQKELHTRYKINDPNTIIVERKNVITNTLRILLQALGQVIRFLANAGIAILAICGLAAICYPDIRVLLMNKFFDALNELHFIF